MSETLAPLANPVEASNPEVLGDNAMANLIVLSFRYSQGSEPLGSRMLSAITAAHPEHFQDGDFPIAAIDSAAPIIQHIRAHAHSNTDSGDNNTNWSFSEETVKTAINNQLEGMKNYPEGSLRTEMSAIAAMVIERDSKFLLDTDPTRGRDKPGRPSDGQRKKRDTTFLSHYVYYGLAGNKAGPKEYNELFAAISEPEVIRALPGVTLSREIIVDGEVRNATGVNFSSNRFKRILGTHFEHYPQDFESIPQTKMAAVRHVIGETASLRH